MAIRDQYPDRPIGFPVFRADQARTTEQLTSICDAVLQAEEVRRLVNLRDQVDSIRWQDSVAASLYALALPRVGVVHVDDETSWLVEWEDGRVTRSDDGA